MKNILDELRSLVYKECAQRNISVRQFLLEIGESSRINWQTLLRTRAVVGQFGLFVKLLNYFNYERRKEN